MSNSLTIYGSPGSQPSRTVFWACLLNDLPFTLGHSRDTLFWTNGTNPRGQIPAMVDGDFCLAEMAAIVCYLAEKHRWYELYPKNLQVRMRIQQFLHMHHTLVRLATYKLMAPYVIKPLGIIPGNENPYSIFSRELLTTAFASKDPLGEGVKVVSAIVEFLEQNCFRNDSPFVCNTDTVSIADLVCYAEIGQLQFAGLFNFKNCPKTRRWLKAMSEVPYHDTIHAYNIQLGDIATNPNTLERFKIAMETGITALRKTGLVT
jgi:glutathione S-transferase